MHGRGSSNLTLALVPRKTFKTSKIKRFATKSLNKEGSSVSVFAHRATFSRRVMEKREARLVEKKTCLALCSAHS